jgi:hypothetical protein
LVNTGWQLRPIDTKRSCGHLQGYICQGLCSHFLEHLALMPVLCFPNCWSPSGRNHLEVTPSNTSPSTRNLTFLLLEVAGSFHSLSFIHSFIHSFSKHSWDGCTLPMLRTPWRSCQDVNSAGAVCDQKILVFVLQMEKSKLSTWMG